MIAYDSQTDMIFEIEITGEKGVENITSVDIDYGYGWVSCLDIQRYMDYFLTGINLGGIELLDDEPLDDIPVAKTK